MFEAYSVAVRVSLINGVSSGLIAMARQFGTAELAAAGLQKRLKSIGGWMMISGASTAAGLEIFAGLEKIANASKGYANQLSLMNTLGMKQADIAHAVGDAWKTAYAVPTSSIVDNLASFRELRSVFGVGHESEASAMLPVVARLQGVMTALTGKPQEHVGFDMVKATELRTGVMTDAALQRNAEMMSRTIIGMGGTITVADYHGALKMGKMATNKWSDDFVYNYLPTLMQEMKTASGGGAQSAGTALQSFYQQAHGRMTKAAIPYWIEAGLISSKDVVRNAGGQWQVRPGGVKNTDALEQNPFAWIQSTLKPGVERIMAKDHVSAETAINAMFSNRNAAFAAYNMYIKAQQYERDKQTIGQADNSYTAYQKMLKTNPALAELALQRQWQNMMAQLGYQIMPDLLAAINAIIPAVQNFTKWMQKNPDALKGWIRGFEVLATVLTVGGTLGMIWQVGRAFKLVFDVFKVGAKVVGFLPRIATGITMLAGAVDVAALAPFLVVGGLLVALAAAVWLLPKALNAAATALQQFFGIADGAARNGGRGPSPGAPGQPHTMSGPRVGTRTGRGVVGVSPYVAPATHGSTVGKNGDVYLDGRKVGHVLSSIQEKAFNMPSGSWSGFDGSRHMPLVGAPG